MTSRNSGTVATQPKNEATTGITKEIVKTVDKKRVREREYTIVKRNGMIVPFRRDRIGMALEAAFRDTKQLAANEPLPQAIFAAIHAVTETIVEEALTQADQGHILTVENIQDIVEAKLIATGHQDVARDYVIYRDKHKALREDSPRNLKVLRRDGETLVRFNPLKIASAIEHAFRDAQNISEPTPEWIVSAVNMLTHKVVARLIAIANAGTQLHIEMIQDEIEQQLMAEGFFEVAKSFIVYRAKHAEARRQKELEMHTAGNKPVASDRAFKITRADGSTGTLQESFLRAKIAYACRGLENSVDVDQIIEFSVAGLYEGIKEQEVDLSNLMAAKSLIERDPAYSLVASRLLLDMIYRETMGVAADHPDLDKCHRQYFKEAIQFGVEVKRLSPKLLEFDLDRLALALDLKRDLLFQYLGTQTIYDRYLIHHQQKRIETPQIFWMRVAMGVSLKEGAQKNERAIEFYRIISNFLYTPATPTLFNSGTPHSQLSSCYLSTVIDDLGHIFKVIGDNAQLSKWAGGIGNDWTNVRATGTLIKGTNGNSQGVIPFLKVVNDTAVAVNQGGKRKGAVCSYLETWHLDVEDFLELRKNTGDERRRTHDMNTANWIPDLFMKRVEQNDMWTLFSPADTPDLHDLYGKAFEKRYCEYEAMADRGEIKLFKRVEALQLWRKMLSMIFETGHPWITFKDPSNIRSPQDHVGVVHSSNLCTEILLNSSVEETAVCNLGSINLVAHLTSQGLNKELLKNTIRTAIRMLDNVIDVNFYPTAEAEKSNGKHRPIGMGIMGFQDALSALGISYASHEAVRFADESYEFISYHAILSSSELAKERGTYATFKGSKWDRGLLPIDTIKLLAEERGQEIEMDTRTTMDWTPVRDSIKKYGMRNSNTMAIAPTATISNIIGVSQSIEPSYTHLFVKSNLSGEFTISNSYLVEKLKALDLWDAQMVDDLKYFDGSLGEIDRVPAAIKALFPTAFEIEPEWILECASRRQKWIDMGQSLNLYLSEPSGKKLHNMYMLAWKKGLKTTYYLRSLGATQIEKSTVDINARGIQPRWMKSESASSRIKVERPGKEKIQACTLGEACESCQ